MSVIEFTKAFEEPDVEFMNRAELEQYLAQLQKELEELDAREPKNLNSEAHEDWEDQHEDLEDLIDEVLDRLDDLES